MCPVIYPPDQDITGQCCVWIMGLDTRADALRTLDGKGSCPLSSNMPLSLSI